MLNSFVVVTCNICLTYIHNYSLVHPRKGADNETESRAGAMSLFSEKQVYGITKDNAGQMAK